DRVIGHQQTVLPFKGISTALRLMDHLHSLYQADVFRMDSRTNQLARNRRSDLDLVDSIELVRPRDFIRCHTPAKASCQAETLAVGEKRFTAPEGGLALCTFNRDAGNVCHLRDEILLKRRRASCRR